MEIATKFLVLKNLRQRNYTDLFPALKEERVQKFTKLVLTLIALSFFGLIAINPTLSTIAQLNKELADDTFVDQNLTQKISNLSTLSDKYRSLEPDLPIILMSVPKNPEIPTFAAQIQSVIKSSNLDLISFQTFEVELASTPKTYSSFSFALATEGTYNDISKFLNLLTSMQRIIAIDNVSLTKKSVGNSLQLNLKGRTFFRE